MSMVNVGNKILVVMLFIVNPAKEIVIENVVKKNVKEEIINK
jgi:hypothetical protein